MAEFKMAHNRIGVLTSGGDCAGLNAAIRAVVYRAITKYGWTVIGIEEGTAGLLHRPMKFKELNLDVFSGNVLRMGGTMLGTVNKGDPFAYPMRDGTVVDRSEEVIEGFRALDLDALVGIGGDGSMRILARLCQQGEIPFVGVPKTMDNDVDMTDFSIGYMSAVNVAVEALDRLYSTASSHRRVMVMEVMGRDVGWVALATAIAGGADVCLIPEFPFSLEKVAQKLRSLYARGHNHALIVCSEGVRLVSGEKFSHTYTDGEVRLGGVGHMLADLIAQATGAETRVTVLGHVQRGGSPKPFDRLLASALGAGAVDLIAAGKTDRVVVWRNNAVENVPLADVAGKTRALTEESSLVQTARALNICLGD